MDEKMLLQAIREIVKAEIEPLNAHMDGMEKHMNGMEARMDGMEKRMDGMEARMDGMEKRMDGMEARMDGMEKHVQGIEKRVDGMEAHMNGMEKRIDARIDRMEVLLEHEIPKQLQLLAEGHQILVNRLPEEHELGELRARVSTLERISADHDEEIRILKQAN